MSERAPDYAQGFKDGFAAGLEEGKKLAPKQTRLDDYMFGQPGYLGSPTCCSACGKDFGNNIWGYVCSNANCPTRVTAYSGGAITGAVGSTTQRSYPKGANGPAGSIGTMNDPYELGN